MINKKDLLKELEKEFESFRKDFDLKPSLEELNLEFNLKNDILSKGFVPELFSKYLCAFIADYFRAWHGYLNGLLVPNPNFFANQTESKLFQGEEDRKIIWELIVRSMEFSSESTLVNLDSNVENVREFINNSYGYCVSEFRPKILEIMKRVHSAWKTK